MTSSSLLHLGGESYAVARPHGADPGLPLQLALRVLVGDPGGDAGSAASGALGPLGGLDRTLPVLQVVPHCQMQDVTRKSATNPPQRSIVSTVRCDFISLSRAADASHLAGVYNRARSASRWTSLPRRRPPARFPAAGPEARAAAAPEAPAM